MPLPHPQKFAHPQGMMLSCSAPYSLDSATGKRGAGANTAPETSRFAPRQYNHPMCPSAEMSPVTKRDPRSFGGMKRLEVQLFMSSGRTTVSSHVRALIPFRLRGKMAMNGSSAPRFALKVPSTLAGQLSLSEPGAERAAAQTAPVSMV